MPKAIKITIWAAAIAVASIACAAVAIPLFVHVDGYRPQVIAQIEKATGKHTAIDRLTLRILPRVAIRVENFSLANPDGFPSGNLAQAKRVDAAVDVIQLLHHHVQITALKFNGLAVDMVENTNGVWNFENPPIPPGQSPGSAASPLPQNDALSDISKIDITDGSFRASELPASGERGPALIDVRGVKMSLNDVNLRDLSPQSAATLGTSIAEGSIQAATIVFGPMNVSELQSRIRLEPRQLHFGGMTVKCYAGDAAGNLSLNFDGPNLAYDAGATLRGVKVEQFLDAFPQTRGVLTGTMEGAAKMQGILLKSNDPLEGAQGSGHATIRDGRMPSLQIAGNLRSLVQLASVGPDNGDPSSFSSLSADFQIAGGRLSSDKIDLDGNGLSVHGSGSLATAGEGSLDYQAEASLAATGSNPLAAVLGAVAGGRFADGKLTVPFTVSGTFARPRFSLQTGAGKDQQANSANGGRNNQLLRGIGAFFKKRKQD